jgi:hypothetical protein
MTGKKYQGIQGGVKPSMMRTSQIESREMSKVNTDRLLTPEERTEINNKMPSEAKYGEVFEAIAEAQDVKTLKAVSLMLDKKEWFGEKLTPNQRIEVLNFIRAGKF